MKFEKLFTGRALYVEKDRIWVARGLSFYCINFEGNRISPVYKVGGAAEKLLGAFRLSRQLLRVGIHHLLPLENGSFFVVLKKRALVLDEDGVILNTFSGYRGNKPGHMGVCKTPDGSIFFGEYSLNMKRENDTKLYRSIDNGLSFTKILEFSESEIRHIHFVQWDKYEKCLWLGTGDDDHECKLYKSSDNGDTWETVGEGSQIWRAVGISFTKDEVFWGTDAGSVSDKNYIISMDRKTRKVEKIMEVEGPCHGNASLLNETVLVSTGVEGGENEEDHFARLYKKDNNGFELILKKRKDIFPLILQYGVIRFPIGMISTERIVFTTYGLKQCGEAVFINYAK